jgi:hypothetical protein
MASTLAQKSLWIASALVALAAAIWAGDAILWRLHGHPTSQVEVMRFVVAPLKGGKEEYYPDTDDTVPCPQSLLPQTIPGQGTANPCWWLQRHKVVFER